ncbi:MAG: hypothetical protein LW693_06525 [Saprospiraceae bacterium]|jgi:hypothetical protein|nr:hypothetical protein [Saprospiraceae bacterium]
MSDLFDFFRENESKLHEHPPEKVWQQLEQRLEKSRRPRRRGIRFFQPVVTAIILFILLLAAVLVWHYSAK